MQFLLHRLLALVCLLAYVAGATPVMGALVGVAGARDASHELVVMTSEEGEKVVLHHRTQTGRLVTDHQGWLCERLVSACSTDPFGDHVFEGHHSSAQRVETSDPVSMAKGPVWPVSIQPVAMGHGLRDLHRITRGLRAETESRRVRAVDGCWMTVRLLL